MTQAESGDTGSRIETDPWESAIDPIATAMEPPLGGDATRRLQAFRPSTPVETVYLSTPITTGPRLLAWLAEHSNAASDPAAEIVREEVINENLTRLVPIRGDVLDRYSHCRLIDPTMLNVPGWSQWEYHRFWIEVIRTSVDRMVFADGWHLSTGCVIEYATALAAGLPMEHADGSPLRPGDAAKLLREAFATLASAHRDTAVVVAAAERAERADSVPLKDTQLAELAETFNVASFVSFTPGQPYLRYRVLPGAPLPRSAGARQAVERLMAASRSASVNVRTFRPEVTKGNPFHYGLGDVDEVMLLVQQAARDGYHCIVNETIDVHDGGVSGVTLGGVAEFAPDDTPRAVEKGDTARMSVPMATRLLRTVYGDDLEIPHATGWRTEFSVHPTRVGHRSKRVIVWEVEKIDEVALDVDVQWPNKFSRLIGDKTFGLLVADALGMPVPRTTAISRRIAPFQFGQPTQTEEWWMRTAPAEQDPGRFTTTRGWTDPFALLAKEDADASIAAVLAQEGVDAVYSGATLPRAESAEHIIEGVSGAGDSFMLGDDAGLPLPLSVKERVQKLLLNLEQELGPGVRIEWAADKETVWVLQLHRVAAAGATGLLSSGTAERWLPFDPSLGLNALHELIADALSQGAGIEVTKPVGLTSHIGDLLRKAKVPGRLAAERSAGAPTPTDR